MDRNYYMEEIYLVKKVIGKYLEPAIFNVMCQKIESLQYRYYRGKENKISINVFMGEPMSEKKDFEFNDGAFFTYIRDPKNKNLIQVFCGVKEQRDKKITRDLKVLQIVKNCSYFQDFCNGGMVYWLGFIEEKNEYWYNPRNRIITANTQIQEVNMSNNKKYKLLTDALTVMVAKFITDQFYEDKYSICNKKYTTSTAKEYFLLSSMILNAFEKNPAPVIDALFTNDLEGFERFVKTNTNYTLEQILENLDTATKNITNYEKYYYLINDILKKEPINNKDVSEQLNRYMDKNYSIMK